MEKLLFPFVSIVGQEDMKKALLLNSIIKAIVTITTSFGIDGHRADITMMKAAKANAARPSRRWLTYIRTPLLVRPPQGQDVYHRWPRDTDAIFDLADRLKIPPEYLLTH